MKTILTVIVLLLSTATFYGQKETRPTIFSSVAQGQTKTLNLDVSNYTIETINQLKNDLNKYHDKIILADFDKGKKILMIKYNEYMLKEDFIRVFESNGVSYHIKKKQPNTINSQPF